MEALPAARASAALWHLLPSADPGGSVAGGAWRRPPLPMAAAAAWISVVDLPTAATAPSSLRTTVAVVVSGACPCCRYKSLSPSLHRPHSFLSSFFIFSLFLLGLKIRWRGGACRSGMEEVGRGQIWRGRGRVRLDPATAAVLQPWMGSAGPWMGSAGLSRVFFSFFVFLNH